MLKILLKNSDSKRCQLETNTGTRQPIGSHWMEMLSWCDIWLNEMLQSIYDVLERKDHDQYIGPVVKVTQVRN